MHHKNYESYYDKHKVPSVKYVRIGWGRGLWKCVLTNVYSLGAYACEEGRRSRNCLFLRTYLMDSHKVNKR